MGEPRPDLLRARGGWATAMGVHSCFSNVCGVLRESPLGAIGHCGFQQLIVAPLFRLEQELPAPQGFTGFHMPVGGQRPKPPGQAVTRNPRLYGWTEVENTPNTSGPRLPPRANRARSLVSAERALLQVNNYVAAGK